jgi:hypothetical protein
MTYSKLDRGDDYMTLVDIATTNPIHPKSIGFSDIKDGLEFIYVDTRNGYIHEGVFKSKPHKVNRITDGISEYEVKYSILNLGNDNVQLTRGNLCTIGVIPDANGKWQKVFLIKNCDDNRRELDSWLKTNDIPRHKNFTIFLAYKYPGIRH